MTLTAVETVGTVTIKLQSRDDRYYLVWRDRAGRPRSKSTGIKATTAKQLEGGTPPAAVLKQARELRDLIGSKFSHVLDKVQGPLIGDAINKAIDHAKAKTEGRRDDLARFTGYFLDWLEGAYPAILHWQEVNAEIVLDYLEYQHGRGAMKPKTLRHYLGPLTLTAKHWARLYPGTYFPLVIASGYLDEQEAPEKNFLTAEQTAHLLATVYMRENRAIPIAVMMGCYAGTNVKEIIRLRVRDFDLEAGTVTITESKNIYRRRTIPLLPMLSTWMKRELAGKSGEDLIVTNTQGEAATVNSIGASLRRAFDHVAKQYERRKDPEEKAQAVPYRALDPKDIRKTFMNLCVAADVSLSDIGAYVGHIPTGMTDRHYAELRKPDRMKRVVIDPLEAFLGGIASTAPAKVYTLRQA